jgi:hypothetical protein
MKVLVVNVLGADSSLSTLTFPYRSDSLKLTITPLELLATSIAQLQTLVAFLDDQLTWTESGALETRACKEIARSLCLLIRTHQTLPYGSLQGTVA